MQIDDATGRDRDLFNKIAGSYARKDLLPAHRLARRHRLLQTLRGLPKSGEIALLEVGCGAGYAANYLRGSYDRFVGIDHAEELVDYARSKNAAAGATFEAMDIRDLPTDQKFDVIFMIGVLHHLEQPEDVLRQLKANVKPGGWIVANEPQRGNPIIGAARAVRKRFDPAYSVDQREYSRAEIVELYETAGFQEVRAFSQGFLSTPFAEVVMPLQPLAAVASRVSCAVDRMMESASPFRTSRLAWNVVVQGRV